MKKPTGKKSAPVSTGRLHFTEKEEMFLDWCLIHGRKGKDWDEFECLWNAGYFEKNPITSKDLQAFIAARDDSK